MTWSFFKHCFSSYRSWTLKQNFRRQRRNLMLGVLLVINVVPQNGSLDPQNVIHSVDTEAQSLGLYFTPYSLWWSPQVRMPQLGYAGINYLCMIVPINVIYRVIRRYGKCFGIIDKSVLYMLITGFTWHSFMQPKKHFSTTCYLLFVKIHIFVSADHRPKELMGWSVSVIPALSFFHLSISTSLLLLHLINCLVGCHENLHTHTHTHITWSSWS